MQPHEAYRALGHVAWRQRLRHDVGQATGTWRIVETELVASTEHLRQDATEIRADARVDDQVVAVFPYFRQQRDECERMLEATCRQAVDVLDAEKRGEHVGGRRTFRDNIDLGPLVEPLQLGNQWRDQKNIAETMIRPAHQDAVDPVSRQKPGERGGAGNVQDSP